MHSAVIGFGLGFFVALQLGPMSLFLVRSTLRGGVPAGLGVGAGIATVDGLYAALGAAGATAVLQIDSVQKALGLLGSVAIAWLGVRSIRAARHATVNGDDRVAAEAWPAFRTSLTATAANPTTILSWAAIFSAVPTDTNAVLLVVGVFVGSLTWVTALALGVGAVRRAVTVRGVQLADALAGVGLLAFAVTLAWHTLS